MKLSELHDLSFTPRTLLGPGPSMVHPRVLAALAMPTLGHLDPDFQGVMDDIRNLLRYTFQTENEYAIPVSGSGSAGMEAAIVNALEPGDRVLIAINGYFGMRMVEMAERVGAHVDRLEIDWGEVFDPDDIAQALKAKKYKALCLVHCETSTGVLQPDIQAIAEAAHQQGALLILDTVASLGGAPVKVDEWGVDICYSGSQKCLSAPPGLAPITVSPQAMAIIRARKTRVSSWYLDLSLLDSYWGTTRVYHHTAPVNMNYALRETLRLIVEEGIENVWQRHQENVRYLWAGLEDLDLSMLVPEVNRSPTLTTPRLFPGIDEGALRKRLLNEYHIEIAGGFGPLAGKVWRIGLMGFSSRRENITLLLSALGELLKGRTA